MKRCITDVRDGGIIGLTKILSPDEFNMREGVKSIESPSVLEGVC